MGLYSDYIFPHLLEFALGRGYPMKYRNRALEEARGEVLEIGFGTGLNLSCYPPGVTRLTLIDPAKHLSRSGQAPGYIDGPSPCPGRHQPGSPRPAALRPTPRGFPAGDLSGRW